jgi:hypothetical protein
MDMVHFGFRSVMYGWSIAANVKALLSVAEIEKQKLNYAEKFI